MAKRAIITGSESGIGRATAVRLAQDGFDVGVTWYGNEEEGAGTAREVEAHGGRAVVRRLDVTRFAEAGEVVSELADELGGLEVFVNNAGGGEQVPFLELELDTWQDVVALNLTGAFVCGQRAARIMVEAGTRGRIVNVTSVHAHIPLAGATAYSAAKGGLGLLTKAMALELGEHGITVNAVAPGEIATGMTGAEDEDPSAAERTALPVGRPGHAKEVAEAIAFLVRDEARYVTGSSVVVDGGLMLTAGEFNRRAQEWT
jgi:NAD(P)-dependent dehydrogenase (short-subunit alcohol dehydrogenase family)